jgi:hypothetical protein
MKNEYFSTGRFGGFLGMRWNKADQQYDDDNGVGKNFLDDGSIVLGNFEDSNPVEVYQTLIYDEEAPEGWTGKFAKQWLLPNPSERWYGIQYGITPTLTHPDQFIYVSTIL